MQFIKSHMVCTHNNTDGNKLAIFSGIALYYGVTYIVYKTCLKGVYSVQDKIKVFMKSLVLNVSKMGKSRG